MKQLFLKWVGLFFLPICIMISQGSIASEYQGPLQSEEFWLTDRLEEEAADSDFDDFNDDFDPDAFESDEEGATESELPDSDSEPVPDASSIDKDLQIDELDLYSLRVDPFEPMNRVVFAFNETMDKYLLRPAAKGYKKVTPGIVQTGVTNFFSNLGEPLTLVSDLLQGNVKEAGLDGARFLVNSTVGLFGFIDVSSRIGLDKRSEDFGQVLGAWGVPSGPYIMLPLVGPSTVRDAFGRAAQLEIPGTSTIAPDAARYSAYALYGINLRARFLETESLLAGDKYTFIRDAYLQNREFNVNDGEGGESEFGDEEIFEDSVGDELLFGE